MGLCVLCCVLCVVCVVSCVVCRVSCVVCRVSCRVSCAVCRVTFIHAIMGIGGLLLARWNDLHNSGSTSAGGDLARGRYRTTRLCHAKTRVELVTVVFVLRR